jgi:hypothetical protein
MAKKKLLLKKEIVRELVTDELSLANGGTLQNTGACLVSAMTGTSCPTQGTYTRSVGGSVLTMRCSISLSY